MKQKEAALAQRCRNPKCRDGLTSNLHDRLICEALRDSKSHSLSSTCPVLATHFLPLFPSGSSNAE